MYRPQATLQNLKFLANFKIIKSIGMNLQYILRGCLGSIIHLPLLRQHLIHKYPILIQPQHGDIVAHEHHVDRGVDLALLFAHEHDPAIRWEFFRQHQAPEAGEEGITNLEIKQNVRRQ